MALSNEDIIAKVKQKIQDKNRKIHERDEEIIRLNRKLEELESHLEQSYKKVENREQLIDTIADILSSDES